MRTEVEVTGLTTGLPGGLGGPVGRREEEEDVDECHNTAHSCELHATTQTSGTLKTLQSSPSCLGYAGFKQTTLCILYICYMYNSTYQ